MKDINKLTGMNSENPDFKKKNYSKPVTKKHDPLNIVRASGGQITLYTTTLYSECSLYSLYHECNLYHECTLYYRY
jgi:hypothetical protein